MNITVKNVEKFMSEFGIIKVRTNCYLVPECKNITYSEENEARSFEIVDFTSLVVNNNDTLRITAYKHIDRRNSILEIYNKKNGSRGYIKAYYGSDDTRYYLCCSVAEYFKDKNVKVENYLIYNKQEVASYVDCMYNL